MIKKLNWEAFSNGERNLIIDAVKDEISNADGSILNFMMFSDLALALSIEIEEQSIPVLHAALTKVLSVSEYDSTGINLKSSKDYLIFLNISFNQGKGDLRQEIPKVPG